jgi:hypothetical protein
MTVVGAFRIVKSYQLFGGALSASMEAEGSSEILVSCKRLHGVKM